MSDRLKAVVLPDVTQPLPALGAVTPRLFSGCKNLQLASMRHQPFERQCRNTMTLFSGSLGSESSFGLGMWTTGELASESCGEASEKSKTSPSEVGPDRSEAKAPTSSVVDSSSGIGS